MPAAVGSVDAAPLENNGLQGAGVGRVLRSRAVTGSSATDQEVESFYQDMSKLIGLLRSLVMAEAYDPDDTAQVYRYHAKFFWAAVRGERTEGHPNFRATVPSPLLGHISCLA